MCRNHLTCVCLSALVSSFNPSVLHQSPLLGIKGTTPDSQATWVWGCFTGQLICSRQRIGWKPFTLQQFTGHAIYSVVAEAAQTLQGQTLPLWLNCHLSEAEGTKPALQFGVWIIWLKDLCLHSCKTIFLDQIELEMCLPNRVCCFHLSAFLKVRCLNMS